MAATGLGLIVSAIWAAALGQTMVACIFGLFSGFWWSYAALVLGLNHNWFAIPAADVQHSVALFQISWAVVMAALTIATLRLPRAFTAVVGPRRARPGPPDHRNAGTERHVHQAGGLRHPCIFAALGGYLFLGAASAATGGAAVSARRPAPALIRRGPARRIGRRQ